MSRFIETICLIDGKFRNLTYHQNRLNKTRYKKLGLTDDLDLEELLNNHLKIQSLDLNKKFKCRILYSTDFEEIEISEYRIRNINSVKLIENNFMDYTYKSEDRESFQLMTDAVEEDEILIVKNGLITDTSYSNVLFFSGEIWVTPNSYLLNGTMRQALLNSGKIIEQEIKVDDLKLFTSFKFINAMMNLEESPELDISIIR